MSRIVCRCGTRIGADPVLPSEVWEQIARGDYALCWDCIDERCAQLGIKCEVDAFYAGRAITTKHPPEIARGVMGWRPGPMCVETSGLVGNPLLYGGGVQAPKG